MKYTISSKHHAERARQAFTRGFPSRSPIDLVESGQRTLTEWLRILTDQRNLEEQISSSVARERCQFTDDNALRFALLRVLSDGVSKTTPELHLGLKATRLSTLRKLLYRLGESKQIEEGMRTVKGLEVTTWRIALRGRRELNGHLARTGDRGITSASKWLHTGASMQPRNP